MTRAVPSRQRAANIKKWELERYNAVRSQSFFVQVSVAVSVQVRHAEEERERRDRSAKPINQGTHYCVRKVTWPRWSDGWAAAVGRPPPSSLLPPSGAAISTKASARGRGVTGIGRHPPRRWATHTPPLQRRTGTHRPGV